MSLLVCYLVISQVIEMLWLLLCLLTANCCASQAQCRHVRQGCKDWVPETHLQVADVWIRFLWSEGEFILCCVQQVIKVILPTCTNRSVVFARWRQCASQSDTWLLGFIRVCHQAASRSVQPLLLGSPVYATYKNYYYYTHLMASFPGQPV